MICLVIGLVSILMIPITQDRSRWDQPCYLIQDCKFESNKYNTPLLPKLHVHMHNAHESDIHIQIKIKLDSMAHNTPKNNINISCCYKQLDAGKYAYPLVSSRSTSTELVLSTSHSSGINNLGGLYIISESLFLFTSGVRL
jgi:hypothetical protein